MASEDCSSTNLTTPVTSQTNTQTNTPAVQNLNNAQQFLSLKLTNTNYLFWGTQMNPFLYGYGHYVDGLYPCPPPTDQHIVRGNNKISYL